MFLVKTFKHRRAVKAANTNLTTAINEQKMLDQLRFANPNNSLLQLHCDRMQVEVSGMAANALVMLAVA